MTILNSLSLSVLAAFSVASSAAQDFDKLPKKGVPTAPVLDLGPLSSTVLEDSIRRGVDHLVATQNQNGSWGAATQTKGLNIYAPLPGAHHAFRMGSSSLALAGLIASADSRPEVQQCITKAEAWLLSELPKLRRADATTTYNNWGHAYGLRALCALAQRPGVTEEKKALYALHVKQQFEALQRNQDIDGGWGYLHFGGATAQPSGGSMCFCTSTVLLAIHEAQAAFGHTFPQPLIEKALLSVRMQRTADFSYVYAMEHRYYPRNPINRPAGSLARTPVCNAATRAWGDERVTDKVLSKSLDRLIKRNGWLDIGRKRPKPHESHFAISGYFYFYGHYYASECILMLPQAQQADWQHKLAHVLLDKQEKDGSWWDYPLYSYHKPYGTGYTLVALSRCRQVDPSS